MKRLWNLVMLTLLALVAGCATLPTETAQDSGPTATCHVCRCNNDLACLSVKVKETTPRTDYQGQTYYFAATIAASHSKRSRQNTSRRWFVDTAVAPCSRAWKIQSDDGAPVLREIQGAANYSEIR
jgi:hypothetical protein